jgi:hypothetical protein
MSQAKIPISGDEGEAGRYDRFDTRRLEMYSMRG